jgi:hypothetical protein
MDLGREVEESEGEVLTVDSIVGLSGISFQYIDRTVHRRGAIDLHFEQTASIHVVVSGAPRPFAECGERLGLGDGAVCRVGVVVEVPLVGLVLLLELAAPSSLGFGMDQDRGLALTLAVSARRHRVFERA